MIKAVIFDLDDTLISEKKYIESGFKFISKVVSKRYAKTESVIYQLLLEAFNENYKNVFGRLLDRLNVPYTKETVFNLVELYRGHTPTIDFYEDVIPCMNSLKSKGLKTGIITDGYAVTQRKKIEAVKANVYFKEIIITDELGREFWKPHPRAFERMREKLDIEFNEMIYIGDNPEKDFYIGNIHSINTIMIDRKDGVYQNAEFFRGIKYNHRIDSLSKLEHIIISFNKSNLL